MLEAKHRTFDKVEISDVLISIKNFSDFRSHTTVFVEVKFKQDHTIIECPDFMKIPFDTSLDKFMGELGNLINGKEERIVLAYGGQDIDFFRRGKKFILKYSPNTSRYYNFNFKAGEINKIRDAITNIIESLK